MGSQKEGGGRQGRRPTFADDGVKKVYAAKGARSDGIYGLAGPLKLQASVPPTMWEDISLTHLNQSELGIIAVGVKVWGEVG